MRPAFSDDEQDELNLAHLRGLGLTGPPVFPRVMAYVFADRAHRDRLIVAVTDEPAVRGTKAQTGLVNGMSGATLTCVGVRHATESELSMPDRRHILSEVRRSRIQRIRRSDRDDRRRTGRS